VTDTDSGKQSWRILAVVLTGSFMAVLDTTIVNVALRSIQQGAHASSCAARAGRHGGRRADHRAAARS
jgi:hypothetical protein